MIEQELKEIWKHAPEQERIRFDVSKLLIDLDSKLEKLNSAIKRRDRSDLIVSIISIPMFAALFFVVPFPMTKVGILLGLLGFLWNILKRRNHMLQKLPGDPSQPFRQQLENQRTNLIQEARMMDTVLYWMLLPGFIPFAISILGLGDPIAYGIDHHIINQLLPMPFMYKIAYLLFAVIVFTAIYWENKRQIRKTLNPMIAEIELAQRELSDSSVISS